MRMCGAHHTRSTKVLYRLPKVLYTYSLRASLLLVVVLPMHNPFDNVVRNK